MKARFACLLSLAVTTVLVGSACTAADDPGAAPSTSASPTDAMSPTVTTSSLLDAGAAASSGCGVVDSSRPDGTIVTADGVTRTYALSLPPDYDPAVPTPLVFDFHGLGSDRSQQALISGVEVAADRQGYIAVIPDGAVNDLLDIRLWNLSGAATDESGALQGLAVDDVAFVAELLDDLEATLCVDTDRVYSMGFSNGGFFSTRLACDLADRFAAVATVAGIAHPDDCTPARPVPVVHFHGTDDEVVPYDGGGSTLLSEADNPVPGLSDSEMQAFVEELFTPIEDEVAQWAGTNGCDPDPTVETISAEVELRRYESCDAPVQFYVVNGGGHTWPGSLVMSVVSALGTTTVDIDATDVAFDWFDAHPRTGATDGG